MNDSQEELAACPFCGYNGSRYISLFVNNILCILAIKCNHCKCLGPNSDTEAEARSAWNDRPARPSVSPVTVNPTEDAFYEKVEASIYDGPTKAGCWWAECPEGRKLLLVNQGKSGVWMARLVDSIHGWHVWFTPDFSVWKNWKLVS